MTNDHLSLDELAELDEGLLPPERTSAVRAHLHGCGQCRARAEAIVSTRSTLAELPAVSMPEAVRARLERAFADEVGEDSAGAGDPVDVPVVAAVPPPAPVVAGLPTPSRSADVTPTLGRVIRPRFGRPTLAASTAAASVILALGAIIFAHYHHGHSTPQATARAGAPAASGSVISPAQPRNFVQSATGREYTTANLTTDVQSLVAAPPAAAAPVASASSSVPLDSPRGTSSSTGTSGLAGSSKRAGKRQAKRDGRSYAAASVDPTPVPTLGLPHQPIPQVLRSLADSRTKILACAAVYADQRGAVPLAVDFGRWTNATLNRTPAAIFVFKGVNPSTVAVFVVPPSCDGTFDTFSIVPLPS